MKFHKTFPRSGRLVLFTGFLFAALLLSACSATAPVPSTATPAPPVPSTGGQATGTAAPPLAATTAPSMTPASSATGKVVQGTPTQAAQPGSPTGSAGPVGNAAAKQAVISALEAYQKAGPYRVDSTITSSGKTQQMTAEVILPDRFHLKMANGMEMIAVGGKTYVKQGDQWMVLPMDIGQFLSGFDTTITQDMINKMTNFQIIGPDVVNGAPAMVYQFDSNFGAGNQSVSTLNKMWVGVASGLPVKQEIDGNAGGVQSKTVQTITFDPNITIEPPQ